MMMHRIKNHNATFMSYCATVQPVSKKDLMKDPEALEAMHKEYKGLLDKKVIDVKTVMDWNECASNPRKEKK